MEYKMLLQVPLFCQAIKVQEEIFVGQGKIFVGQHKGTELLQFYHDFTSQK